MRLLLNNPLLHRYWFRTGSFTGYGITAFSRRDAKELLRRAGAPPDVLVGFAEVIEVIDVSTLEHSQL